MAQAEGKTKLWCHKCNSIEVCRSVNLSKAHVKGERRLVKRKFKDIRFFRRARQCSVCKEIFLTAEVADSKVDELVRLRMLVDQLRERIEACESIAETSKRDAQDLWAKIKGMTHLVK